MSGTSSASQGVGSQGKTLQCRITEWHAVAWWDWDFKEDTCAVCSYALNQGCLSCTIPGTACPPVQGQCKHVFHKHCIQRSELQGKCPLCRADWVPLVDCSEPSATPK